ncbi:MAG: hypothetical protein GY765_34435 [bacterium]|nr:hypothetical protein [bacterium]
MKKTNLKKKLVLNKVTVAGLNAGSQAGILGGFYGDTGPTDATCKPCDPLYNPTVKTCGFTCRQTCEDVTACYFPVSSEPVDLTC